ncbi:MAG: GNAT family N-acetyltransferase, partial [Lachnospiraceae bacterium]|nr:GNAT family N-acetyltransferase [Lachnospiraceae bacterium]
DNAELFSSVLTPDLAEDISVGRLYAIGALRRDDSEIYGVGAIVFHIEESIVYESGILRVMWLYVNPDYRQRGVAHHLIGEVLKIMVDQGIHHASAEFPVKSDHSIILNYILGSWHFEMETGLNPEALFKARDVYYYGKTGSYKKGAKSLASLDEKTYRQLVSNTLRRYSYRGYLRRLISDGSYIDRDLSCYMGNVTDVSAILLAHRLPSGRCRVDYLNCVPGQERQMGFLLCSFMEGAAASSEDETLIEIPVEMEEIGLFLDEVCPRQMGMYLAEGVLMPPAEDTDMDKADVEQLLATSDL